MQIIRQVLSSCESWRSRDGDVDRIFCRFDHGSKGVLTRAELKGALLAVFGFPFVKSDIQHLWVVEGLSHQQPPGLSREVFRAIVRRRAADLIV
ncbi:unnamed protein product [Vitrella brassicaformis CCMP3155]|uniref:EF-hand domain-containing protein n=1 Tax=Vitrella brassicaformis (strain CCMP3155) TaxID=1169540 RepID=A0A0G4H5I2_VITBC|nr:unnamed protein product [Vitrella brassicaformis CCMP3155]|eukprot:CEM39038.1 unnamed protein product [Vitrella brassicaformis CCMP3155]